MNRNEAQNLKKLVTELLKKPTDENSMQIISVLNQLIGTGNDHVNIRANAYIKRARHIYEFAGDYDSAIEDYKESIRICSKFLNNKKSKKRNDININELENCFYYAHLRLGSIYGKLGDFERSNSYLGVAIKDDVYCDKSNFEYGRNALRQKKYGVALHYFNLIDKNGKDKKYYYLSVAQTYALMGNIQESLKIIQEGINNECCECYSYMLCYCLKNNMFDEYLKLMNEVHGLDVFVPSVYLYYESILAGIDYSLIFNSNPGYNLLQFQDYSVDRAIEHIMEHSNCKILSDYNRVKLIVEKSSLILKDKECVPSFDICDSYNISSLDIMPCIPEEELRVYTLPNDKSKVLTIFPPNNDVLGSYVRKASLIRKKVRSERDTL